MWQEASQAMKRIIESVTRRLSKRGFPVRWPLISHALRITTENVGATLDSSEC
jgi:hypothetical protein